jgi:hypothetical protein
MNATDLYIVWSTYVIQYTSSSLGMTGTCISDYLYPPLSHPFGTGCQPARKKKCVVLTFNHHLLALETRPSAIDIADHNEQ